MITCHFLNVGQGTSQVIEIGQQRAIIVDAGPKNGGCQLLRLLADRKIETIEWLILSHNDGDHINGVDSLLRKYADKIKKIGFLVDRNFINQQGGQTVIQVVQKYSTIISRRLEVDAPNLEKSIFDEESTNTKITLLFPTLKTNLLKLKNDTCAILALHINSEKIIFSGDAPIAAWRDIVTRNKDQRIITNILTVPHHGGVFASQEELNEFHSQLVKTDYAIASFASNREKIPRSEVIQSFVKHGIEVFCTQRARQCGGTENNMECCGTIIVDIGQSLHIRNGVELRKRKSMIKPRLCCAEQ